MLLKGRDKAIDKIKRSLDIFEDAKDKIIAVLLLQDKTMQELEEIDPEVHQGLEDIINNTLPSKENCIYDEQGVSLKHIEKWNAFYGDRGSVPMRCVELGIPVMIENMEI